jgi:hypothetical protein
MLVLGLARFVGIARGKRENGANPLRGRRCIRPGYPAFVRPLPPLSTLEIGSGKAAGKP